MGSARRVSRSSGTRTWATSGGPSPHLLSIAGRYASGFIAEVWTPGGDSLRSVAEHDYDSTERRCEDADQMRAAGLAEEEVATRMRADLDQARHPVEVVTGEGTHPKARKGRSRRGKSAERTMTGR